MARKPKKMLDRDYDVAGDGQRRRVTAATKQVNIRVSGQLHEELRKEAFESGESITQIVIKAIENRHQPTQDQDS